MSAYELDGFTKSSKLTVTDLASTPKEWLQDIALHLRESITTNDV